MELIPVRGIPRIEPGDQLAQLIVQALEAQDLSLVSGDVLVLAQKIVSKAENRYVRLAHVSPSDEALALARDADKDPRQMQCLLDESRAVLRVRPGVVIVEHRNGYVHANAGIDKSNIPNSDTDPQVLLLPEDPDRSAALLRQALQRLTGVAPGVLINDSFGRAWRNGTVGVTLGSAGIQVLNNQIGEQDMYGNVLEVTEAAVADELAAAASLLMGQAAEAVPVVLVRGSPIAHSEGGSASLIRDRSMDMFR